MRKYRLKLKVVIFIVILSLTSSLIYAEINFAQKGKYEYLNNCAVCHGTDGKGKGPMAGQLIKSPKNLTLLSKNNGGSFPETAVYQLIDGRRIKITDEGREMESFHGPKDMPIWGDRFRAIEVDEGAVDERISNLLKYLESIQAN